MDRSNYSISMISLGCSKNLVDAECMVKRLKDAGYNYSEDNRADVLIINTCGFIESAKKEAIDTILSAGDLKSEGLIKYIIVSGCLPQRYSKDILKEMPEVDIVLGTSHYKDILEAVDSLLLQSDIQNEYVTEAGGIDHLSFGREISTKSFAWLKIGEGCLNRCSFCAIPLIRGKFISRPLEEILEEAPMLAGQGYKEIILAAQDTTNYGLDLYKKRSLPVLLRELSKINGIDLIRVMYGYMDGIDDELIEEIATNPKVAHYLDIPIQHGDDEVLRRMNRRDTADKITETLQRLRSRIPDIIIRTTVLVGFPGETEEQFETLKENLRKWRFDRLGCFSFSPEEGTKAYDMDDQIPEEVKAHRNKEIYDLQSSISLESNNARLGSIVTITIDSISEDGIFYIGRSYGEAPEVDPSIYVLARNGELQIGQRVEVEIVEASQYELTGVTR